MAIGCGFSIAMQATMTALKRFFGRLFGRKSWQGPMGEGEAKYVLVVDR